MQYLPEWFPGTGFKRIARKWRSNGDELVEKPHAFVKEQMVIISASEALELTPN